MDPFAGTDNPSPLSKHIFLAISVQLRLDVLELAPCFTLLLPLPNLGVRVAAKR